MTFEVLEPTWEDLIAKISGGKVSNVDQVLQIHSDFLSTCLNDCLLSNPQLLSTVKKVLGVCSEFSYYMNDLENMENFDAFENDVDKENINHYLQIVLLLSLKYFCHFYRVLVSKTKLATFFTMSPL